MDKKSVIVLFLACISAGIFILGITMLLCIPTTSYDGTNYETILKIITPVALVVFIPLFILVLAYDTKSWH